MEDVENEEMCTQPFRVCTHHMQYIYNENEEKKKTGK